MAAEGSARPFPIRAKLLAASGVLLVGSMLAYGIVAFESARRALLPSIREQLADDAINVKGGVEEMLAAHYLNVRTWARLPIMREIVVRDLDKTIAHFLESVHRDYGVYLDVLVLDREAICVASSRPEDIATDFSRTPLAPIDDSPGRGDSIPTVNRSSRHGAWFVRLASPIPDPENPDEVLGTLVAMLDRDVIDRIVVSKPGHSQVEMRLLDEEDRVIAGRRDQTIGDHLEQWTVGHTKIADHPGPGDPALVHEGVDSHRREFIIGEVAIGGHDALPVLGWRLAASVPKDLALAPVTTVRNRVFGTGSALILLGLVAAVVFAERLTRPINELTQVATRIARSGDLEPIPAPSSRDEVGELAEAFQRMVTAVANANDELVRSSKLSFLGEMAAGMAHEIRTPLGIIRSSAQLLERRMHAAGDAEAGEWAVFIREESDRLARVVTDLLDYVRPSEPRKSVVDLDALVRRTVHFLGSEAAKRDVHLDIEEVPSPVEVACDADQIHQVSLNLVMNAMQACPRGGWVKVRTTRDDHEARLVVRDSGRGIPAELIERLFEPFATKREGGIGLGLAIVRRIVRGHGGEVAARNLPEGGAEFVVSLPLNVPADAEGAAPAGPAADNDRTQGARIIS